MEMARGPRGMEKAQGPRAMEKSRRAGASGRRAAVISGSRLKKPRGEGRSRAARGGGHERRAPLGSGPIRASQPGPQHRCGRAGGGRGALHGGHERRPGHFADVAAPAARPGALVWRAKLPERGPHPSHPDAASPPRGLSTSHQQRCIIAPRLSCDRPVAAHFYPHYITGIPSAALGDRCRRVVWGPRAAGRQVLGSSGLPQRRGLTKWLKSSASTSAPPTRAWR